MDIKQFIDVCEVLGIQNQFDSLENFMYIKVLEGCLFVLGKMVLWNVWEIVGFKGSFFFLEGQGVLRVQV